MIVDRITESKISSSSLPNEIPLGRYAIFDNGIFRELTQTSFKPSKGQFINQEILDSKYKDKHEIFESIGDLVDAGAFQAIPLIQGIKKGLKFGDFELALENNIWHLEAIFHAPHTKLSRTTDKVPVSKAKRISTRSYDYLAAHTEDWLHKGLISFHPSRIITEEIIVDEDVFENRLLVAFIIRAAHYLERRISHTKDISNFIEQYATLLKKNSRKQGWYKRIEREMELAGKVYDEDSGNYKAVSTDAEIVSSTQRRLMKLRDSLLKLRQYDLFYNVSVKDVNSIIYHDTNVMINHQHYRYLKELWMLFNKEENLDTDKDKRNADDVVINNIRKFGLTIINYAIQNPTYLKYNKSGKDSSWTATKENYPNITVKYGEDGIIKVQIDKRAIRFIVLCSPPDSQSQIPIDSYVLVYDNQGKYESNNTNIIPVSLNDISSVERVATIIRKYLLECYLDNTIFHNIVFPRSLRPYIGIISSYCDTIHFDEENDTYHFIRYPKNDIDWKECFASIKTTSDFCERSRPNQNEIIKYFNNFTDNYDFSVIQLQEHLRCFELDCENIFESWSCDKLNYLKCPICGAIIDCSRTNHITFKANNDFSDEELGMDYIELVKKTGETVAS